MDPIGRSEAPVTPFKDSEDPRLRKQMENSKYSENSNPNLSTPSLNLRKANSPVIKSAKSQKSASKGTNHAAYMSPRNRISERKFIIAKKHGKRADDAKIASKCQEKGCSMGNSKKCLCMAYQSLKASQEEFFKNQSSGDGVACGWKEESDEIEKGLMMHDIEAVAAGFQEGAGEKESNGLGDPEFCESGETNQIGSSVVKRRRDRLMEEARKSVPESGAGRVMHLVKAFEKLLTIPNETEDSKDGKEAEEEENAKAKNKLEKWALPGLQLPKVPEIELSNSSFCMSELMLTAENLGLDKRSSLSSSWDSSQGSMSSRNSTGSRRSRRNSTESCGTTLGGSRWKKKQLKVTTQKPFKLRTEQRGKLKEDEFMKKIQEMMEEQERLRIPIAQGLPWTTDEPECLIKPPVKENTRPIDLKLHSDLRAMERAEFDQQVAEKMNLIEQYKMEREKQLKLEEEEEIRRLRKELVPKAQPMPYFDRPFIPRRSSKHPTMPREPKFHIPQHKKIKCGFSWNDISPYVFHQ
ncbi:hypothetical protein SAY86_005654 [Trapa natans]|uniref:TPX2 C-terminal domain-containing protein n=1 Tax=Trapa natans TaxID=22666 RepID=A0AAN7L136_TRANT|nr:hypothetical protein SAY86_005654 [Trapa natans]